ncbi:MAG TPA: thioredoxin family protein [Deltaproteobacteria bacterium]|nr:thioredoxin family protein [Deltaproteobacteria bacterium]
MPSVEESYPGLATGFLKSATLAEMDKETLLQGDGVEIQASFAEKDFGQAPPEIRKGLEKNMFFLLEQKAILEFIKQDAETMGISVKQPEQEMVRAYVNQLTKDLTVTEAEMRTFYDGNKEMVGDTPFEQVKGSIEPFLLQQKKQEVVEAHIANLGKGAHVRLNRDWVKKHAVLARDNPVDRARMSGKPSMIEFGSTGCVPCDMMQPILENLRKKFPDKLNVVFVHVGEDKMLGARFGIRVIPVQVFYDAKGKEIFRHQGFYAEKEVLKQLKKIGVE